MALVPRAVVVHRRTDLDGLVDEHGTRRQAEFFLRSRGRSLADVQARHDAQTEALADVVAALPAQWRRGDVERTDLPRFGFEPEDVVIVVGQDGLVANIAKYLDGQPVVGIDPEPTLNPGVLVRYRAAQLPALLAAMPRGETRAMVRAMVDDGRTLDALNEVFVGHPSHQSARYRLEPPGDGSSASERQSSSGIIAATGTGATGWAASIRRERRAAPHLPAMPEPTEGRLVWFVREAWPSPATGTDETAGSLALGESLRLTVESDTLVLFGDGLEADHLSATWGQGVTIGVSPRSLRLI
jgi:hypothetical protein